MDKYKLLVVDDEMIACKKVELLLKKTNLPYEIVDFAQNGEEALRKYELHKPDLILTDIQMPVMDGLEFIKTVRKKDKKQKFVILSCHENFNYAREAITMNIKDYLLKDLLNSEDFYELLYKIQKELQNEEEDTRIVSAIENQLVEEYKDVALRTIIFKNQPESMKKELIRRYNLNLDNNYFVVMSLVIDDYKTFTERFSCEDEMMDKINRILTVINKILNNMYKGECIYNGEGEFIALVSMDNKNSELKYIDECTKIANSIKTEVAKIEENFFTVGISQWFSQLSKVHEKYKEANKTTNYKIFLGKGKTLFSNATIFRMYNVSPETIEQKLRIVESYLKENNQEKVVKEIKNLYNKDIKGFMQYNYLKYINTYLFAVIINWGHENSIDYQKIFNCNYIPINILEQFETVDEISKWFTDVFSNIIEIRKKENINYSIKVKDAIKCINNNYQAKLQEIADDLNVNKSYLCRLFKKETGENITDYVLKARINEAKDMILTTNLKMWEIAEKLGYSYPQQFTIDFKKITGITPLEYRLGNA